VPRSQIIYGTTGAWSEESYNLLGPFARVIFRRVHQKEELNKDQAAPDAENCQRHLNAMFNTSPQ